MMVEDRIYAERVTSPRTTGLFVALALLFLLLFVWRAMASGFGPLSMVFFGLFCFFSFYSLNYSTLIIHLTRQSLILRFGIFTWTVPLDSIAACALDDVSIWRIGGAGIHFTPIRGRYRAMFNFLEFPRVVVGLKSRRGLVRDIAFSTRRPDDVKRIIAQALMERGAA